MGRPRVHDEQTERELLAAAEGLLAGEGAEALSVRRLAEAAGTTPRAIYSVFGGKDGLVRALYREAFRALARDLDALPLTADPAADLVAAGVRGFRRWALQHPELFRLAFERAEADAPPTVQDSEVARAAFERLIGRVRRLAEQGLIAPGSVEPLAVAFHSLCEGLASVERRRTLPLPWRRDPEAVWTASLAALVRGFRA